MVDDVHKPFVQTWESLERRFHHLPGLLRQFHAGLIGRRDQCYARPLALPGHRRRTLDPRRKRGEPGAIPVVFQDAPAALAGIVLPMRGRRVSQPYGQARAWGTIPDAPPTWG